LPKVVMAVQVTPLTTPATPPTARAGGLNGNAENNRTIYKSFTNETKLENITKIHTKS
jgi:hypothetical protein